MIDDDDDRDAAPVSPFVRRRWRRRLGLPDAFVASVGVPGAPLLDERTATAALFTCSAAVVGTEYVRDALALGTPVVCTSAVATSVGAVAGEHVLVADDPGEARQRAELLAGDDVRAATLARNALQLVAREHAEATASVPALATLADELALLGTPPGSSVRTRVGGYVSSLGRSAAAVVEDVIAPASTERVRALDADDARRIAEAFGLPSPSPAPLPRTSLRQRLASKSVREIVAAVWRRLRR